MNRYLFAVLAVAICNRVIHPATKEHSERIQDTEYEVYAHQNLTLIYDQYGGVYSLDLYNVTGTPGNQTKIRMPSIYEREQWGQQNTPPKGCFPHSRELDIVKHHEWGFLDENITIEGQEQPTNPDPDVVPQFIELAVDPDLGMVYVVRDDFVLLELEFMPGRTSLEESALVFKRAASFAKLEMMDEYNLLTLTDIRMVCTENHFCYMFSEVGVVYFNAKSPTLDFKSLSFEIYRPIYSIHYSRPHHTIYVAQDYMGVGIFSVGTDGTLTEVKSLEREQFKMENLDVRDVAVNKEGTLLFALDYNTGLYVFDVKSPVDYAVRNFTVHLTRCKAFNFHQQTFFILASTLYQTDYAVEVFVDFVKGTYYLNKLYKQDMQLYDSDVHDHWAILIGFDAHRVAYHSVYHNFIEQNERQVYFDDYDLVKVESFQKIQTDDDSRALLFGLSNDDVRLFQVRTTNPKVSCSNTDRSEHNYTLIMNSTQCMGKKDNNDHSQFSQCQIEHRFQFRTLEVYLDESNRKTVMFALIGVMYVPITSFNRVFIVLLLLLGLGCWFKWGRQILEYQQRVKKHQNERFVELNDQGGLAGEGAGGEGA